ncbi:MAG: hypothetical protein B1H40_01465 [Candidatus Latescibacteria bacterium 4484_181]|nr:MAG: hypothetical protein B1H40_01465 [Candidatus Latescibacteria bacterium 4484_181]RKY69620.1 MAG: hypothetical protein DRQ02_00440 [Candidatus Latescibacterota bacterium]RKY73922.1 MAG: hypothetical protein DRQ24_01140 [Candidatus Latescibacterota bacterium]
MRLRMFGLLGLVVALLSFPAYGAEHRLFSSAVRNGPQPGTKHPGSLSLLDPEHLSMSQSYSLMFLSDGKRCQTSGFYLNRLIYQFSAPISLKLEMGYLHSSFLGEGKSAAPAGKFFPALELLYQPSRNFSLRLQYRVLPSLRSFLWYPHCRSFNR